MKADVYSLDGKKTKAVELPEQFGESYEPDLIKRAILAIFSHNRQPYGTFEKAGQGYAAKLSRRRRDYRGAYGKGISRVSRKTMWRRGMQFGWVGALVPGTVGGRRAHPPKPTKIWNLNINTKERRKAIRSALSGVATKAKIYVIEDKFENLKKAKEVSKVFESLGMETEGVKRKRAGKGKNRGRPFRFKKNALVVVNKKCDVKNVISNLPGYDAVDVRSLNASVLTLGDKPRNCIFTESALSALGKERLFYEAKK